MSESVSAGCAVFAKGLLSWSWGSELCDAQKQKQRKQDLGDGECETRLVWENSLGRMAKMGWECGVNRSYFLMVAKGFLSYFRGMIAMSRCDGSARMEPHEWLDAMSHLI